MKRSFNFRFIAVLLFSLTASSLFGQEIVTASAFFNSLSAGYGTIDDYMADLTITKEGLTLEGVVYYKTPNLLRINFTDPADQVIVVNNEKLMIYLPEQNVVMTQKLREKSESTLAAMVSEKGLRLLSQGYSISYLTSPDPEPLEEESTELVVKLRLEWRSTDEGFRQIIMSVGEDNMIRRMEGLTVTYETVVFDFKNIRINQNIPEKRFEYDSPPSAYDMKNFLFDMNG